MFIYSYNEWYYNLLDYNIYCCHEGYISILIYMFFSYVLLYILMFSSTIFLGLLILLSIFIIQIILLFSLCQFLFALFLLGVYVGAILVFFIFVVMSFVFFGKNYKLQSSVWVLYNVIIIIYFLIFYNIASELNIGSYDNICYSSVYYYSYLYYNNDLMTVGYLLFDIDMVYIVVVVSFLLFIALLGSITFNASNLVKYSSCIYKKG